MCGLTRPSPLLEEDEQDVFRLQLLSFVYEKHVLRILCKPPVVHDTAWLHRRSSCPK
uniref:Uncharacterized protein n=1 Tax=Lepeophtheirus salmonis TaxID=72036 RepID=A0A0K2V7R0_LEPSM